MRIAIPLAEGEVAPEFGRAPSFAVVEVNDYSKELADYVEVEPPSEDDQVIPWLAQQGVKLVLASSIQDRDRNRCMTNGIDVVSGVGKRAPQAAVSSYLQGKAG
jgi:predicted Fe-Mo cluster-binding NifX family protein